ncbi:MAG: peroxiredoxin-like family protein [Nevskiales bacterium]|nr:peroxiredoxin-like family protein [Nevskiales bacterium]
MNLLKSLYVSAFITAAVAGSIASVVFLVTSPEGSAAWIGALLACLPAALFFARLYVAPTARTSPNLWWMPSFGVAGTVLALFLAAGPHPAAWTAFGVGVIGSLLYIFWYSRFGNRASANVRKGQRLPAFELEDEQGQPLPAAGFEGRPTLWIFYRGNWCPLCMAQIREVADQYRELAARGAEVLLISPQPAGHSRDLATRFDAPMRFLTDRDNRAARALGILAENGLPSGLQALGYDSDVPLPTVLITDAAGIVVYSDLTENYRIRPEPDAFIEVLDGLTAR